MGNEKLAPAKQAYVEARAKGIPRQQSAVLAGLPPDRNNLQRLEETRPVALELQRIRKEAAENAGVTKEMVAQGLRDAAEMARAIADPVGMVSAWRELGRMLGFYAPEVKKLEKGINKKDLRKALEDLSDEELFQLSRGRTIEGDFKRVDEPAVPQLQEKLPGS